MTRNRIVAGAFAFASGVALAALPSFAATSDYKFELVGKPQLSGHKDVVQIRLVHVADGKPAPSTASAIADTTVALVGTSAASLNALLAEWDRAGFLPPSKPGQSRVYGRNGYVTSGAGYDALVSLIRSAVTDVRAGRDREAATKIANARGILAAASPARG